MYNERELLERLPSRQKEILRSAIGRPLADVRRYFVSDIASFLEIPDMSEQRYFSHNSGPTAFSFEGGPTHHFAVWGEQLSLVLLDNPLVGDEYGSVHALTEVDDGMVVPELKAVLGQTCEDVTIWRYREAIESEEAKEAAVSYRFASGRELFYCIYLHEDLDSDYLIFRDEVDLGKAGTHTSLAAEVDLR